MDGSAHTHPTFKRNKAQGLFTQNHQLHVFKPYYFSVSVCLCLCLSLSLSLSPPPLSYLVTRPIAELLFMINSLLSRSGIALSVMTVLKVNTQFR